MMRPRQCASTELNKRFKYIGKNPLRAFARDEDGAMIIFGIFVFGLMLMIGGLSFDLMRYEAHRERLQGVLDRAVLAAASLSQTLEPEEVVMEYFAAAGMADYIDSADITVTEGLNSRRVEASAYIHVPLHHGNFGVFSEPGSEDNTLIAAGTSVAEESIGNVEISLVLDVSGSMNSYNRLANLQEAAKGFIDSVYDAAEEDAVSTSIIPYATQVSAGEDLLAFFSRDDSHEYSHCVNFTSSDFDSTTVSTTFDSSPSPYEQTVHFDPWTDEGDSFDLGEEMPYPVCRDDDSRDIMVWSTDKEELKDYIDDFVATGNTSTDVGTKWGAAMLDPSTQPILADMISSGDVDEALDGRPFNYEDGDSMKILVVMTDGAHTSQYYMDDHRTGDSFVWRYEQSGVIHYSIWYDGAGSTPETNPTGNYTYCDGWYWNNGSCGDWDYGSNPDFWFHAYSDDGYSNDYDWRSTPYGGSDAVQMDWSQVWAEIPPEYFSDEVLWEMSSLNSTERNSYEYAINYVGSSTKNSRFDDICDAVTANNVIIFAVGLEVTSSNADRLEDCASSAAHYYDVDNLDIDEAFASIASQINQLRLIQ